MKADALEQSEEIKRAYAERYRRRLLPGLLAIIWGLFLLFSRGRPWEKNAWLFVAVFAVLALGMLTFTLWNWRCPACNRFLGSVKNPKFCPRCGAQLQ